MGPTNSFPVVLSPAPSHPAAVTLALHTLCWHWFPYTKLTHRRRGAPAFEKSHVYQPWKSYLWHSTRSFSCPAAYKSLLFFFALLHLFLAVCLHFAARHPAGKKKPNKTKQNVKVMALSSETEQGLQNKQMVACHVLLTFKALLYKATAMLRQLAVEGTPHCQWFQDPSSMWAAALPQGALLCCIQHMLQGYNSYLWSQAWTRWIKIRQGSFSKEVLHSLKL